MTSYEICIEWLSGAEHIALSELCSGLDLITTWQRWGDDKLTVIYKGRVVKIEGSEASGSAEIHYRSEDQKDPNICEHKNKIDWGVSKVKWNVATGRVTARWANGFNLEPHIRPDGAWLFGGPEAVGPRRKSLANVMQRPNQCAVRDYLLRAGDGACVLTGEREIDALEAAHILSVEDGGAETDKNMVLMRADLHALFDAKRIWFEIGETEAKLQLHGDLTQSYRDQLQNAGLRDNLFARVKDALVLASRGGHSSKNKA
jgi:hypothetical protein